MSIPEVLAGTLPLAFVNDDCLVAMRGMPDACIDAIVTDPPYGISFMGKEWDTFAVRDRSEEPNKGSRKTGGGNPTVATGFARGIGEADYSPSGCAAFVEFMSAVMAECRRILKPGGHMLVFGGTRTFHRLACAIEDAGFELRDTITHLFDADPRVEAFIASLSDEQRGAFLELVAPSEILQWCYGSGFPKAGDVGRMIDKMGGRIGVSVVSLKEELIRRFDASGKTRNQIDEECGFRACNYLTLPLEGKRPDPWVNVLPSQEKWLVIKRVVGCVVDDILDAMFEEAQREVIGQQTKARSESSSYALPTCGAETKYETWDVTAPATEAAKKWTGWAAALKPAYEPIIMARKPCERTLVDNVLTHGTGALNIDASRIATNNKLGGGRLTGPTDMTSTCGGPEWDRPWMHDESKRDEYAKRMADKVAKAEDTGRWPANLILDEAAGKLLDEQSGSKMHSAGNSVDRGHLNHSKSDDGTIYRAGLGESAFRYGDGGDGASRFFYTAKASKRDRGSFNSHPCVKPISLIEYLVRLVTPPGGLILDPFVGSGTTLVACQKLGFRCIGIENDTEHGYAEIVRRRLAGEDPEDDLPAPVPGQPPRPKQMSILDFMGEP